MVLFTVLFTIPTAVVVSQWTGVVRCRCPIFGEGELKHNSCLAIVVKCAEFGFCRGSNNKLHYGCADMESPVQLNGFTVIWHPSHEKMPTRSAAGVCFGYILSIGMYIHNHVWGMKACLCFWLTQEVIQQLDAPALSCFCCFCLFNGNHTEGH